MQEAVIWAHDMEAALRALRSGGHKALARNLFKIPSTVHEVTTLPRISADSFCGIYFLFVADRCVYVGKAFNVHSRVRTHYVGKREAKTFDSYSWFACTREELDLYERYFIQMICPPLNVAAAPLSKVQVVHRASTTLPGETQDA